MKLPAGVPLVAYRTAQEALTNVRKHAQATRVQLDLALAGGVLSLEVTDNGRGLSEEDLAKARSFGIRGYSPKTLEDLERVLAQVVPAQEMCIVEVAVDPTVDPGQVVHVHQHVTVTVLDVDLQRGRISLSMKSKPGAVGAEKGKKEESPAPRPRNKQSRPEKKTAFNNPFEKAFRKP
jgi:hypothetical protein